MVIDFNAFVPKNTFATYLYPWGSAYVISFLLTTSTLERRHIFITMFLKLESYLEHAYAHRSFWNPWCERNCEVSKGFPQKRCTCILQKNVQTVKPKCH